MNLNYISSNDIYLLQQIDDSILTQRLSCAWYMIFFFYQIVILLSSISKIRVITLMSWWVFLVITRGHQCSTLIYFLDIKWPYYIGCFMSDNELKNRLIKLVSSSKHKLGTISNRINKLWNALGVQCLCWCVVWNRKINKYRWRIKYRHIF